VETVRVGVIGTGMMGCEHLRNLLAAPGVSITAVADPNPEPLAWARATLDGSSHRPVEFTDHRQLLASGLVDAVIVASPNFTHRSVLDDVFDAGLHVLVEKPMCTTVDDCLAVVERAQLSEAVTWVGLEYRYMPPISTLRSLVEAGEVGRLRMLSIREHRFPFLQKVDNWNRFNVNTGGTLVEKCCHFFDLMNLLVSARPVRVFASGAQDLNHLDERYDGRTPDILDNAYVIVDYDNGVRAMLDLCMFAEAGSNEQEIVVVGDLGKIEAAVPGDGHVVVGTRATREIRRMACTPVAEAAHVGFHHGASYIEVVRFLDAVRRGLDPEVDVAQGLWSVAIGVAAHRSIESGVATPMGEVLAAGFGPLR
jgi:myo-inositol 2-dehydrogenase/D-chiro-inositol 1-dehydrogenase